MNGPLLPDEIERFNDQGYVICGDLLRGEVHASATSMVEELALLPDTSDRWQHYRELTESGSVLTRTENFLPYHEGLRGLLTTGTVVAAISQLFGEEAVVFKEKVNYKLPGGGGFAPHQDAKAYAYGTSHITCLISIDEQSIENGCLWFTGGAHKNGLLETDETGCLPAKVADALEWVAAPLSPGGVTFFSSYAPHKSLANRSQQSRRSLYVTYNRASEGDLRKAYYEDRNQTMAQHDTTTGDPPRISTIGHFQGRGVE